MTTASAAQNVQLGRGPPTSSRQPDSRGAKLRECPSIWQDVGSYPSGLGRKPVPVRFQFVIDCADPDRLARFWAAALGYELAPVPDGFATWNDFYRKLGVPEEELVDGADRISDPEGHGPSICVHVG